SARHRGRSVGDGSGGNSAAILFAVGSRFRFSQARQDIRAALPIRAGAGSALGDCAVSAAAADWSGLGVRRDCGFTLRTFFGENSGSLGLSGRLKNIYLLVGNYPPP